MNFDVLEKLTGWSRRGLLAYSGLLATFALPPFFIFPLIIPAFSGLYLFTQSAGSGKRAFWGGWWWGMGFYTTGLYWFCIALLTDPEKFAWMIPFALFLVPAVLSIYTGIAAVLFRCTRMKGAAGVFVFASIWVLVEYARGHLFGGFPWNLQGYSFAVSNATLQMASLVGAYGLTWFAVLLGSVPALFYEEGAERKKAKAAIIAAYALLALGTGWGAWRLAQNPEAFVEGISLRLVQPNIAQQYRWEPGSQMANMGEIARLSRSKSLDGVTYLIWPETAVPFIIKPGSGLVYLLGSGLPEGTLLITGTIRAEGEPKQLYNGLVAVDHDGTIVGTYDKAKLVPFGEFLPLRRFLPKAWTTPVGDTDFAQGPGPRTVQWGKLFISPLICYEAIFPELAIDPTHRPDVLLNVTNDAWFGQSTGPYQHFQMARTRAVEQGIPLVRTANTGISAVIDSYGRIVSKYQLGDKGILDEKLPVAQAAPTLYGRINDGFLLAAAIVSLGLITRRKSRGKY